MANKGWNEQQGGGTVSSNARTTMRTSGTGNAESFIEGSKIAHPGPDNDPLDERSDLFEVPQLTESHGCSN